MRYVWMAVLAVVPFGPVFAGSWDVFYAQCVAPFEVFAAPPDGAQDLHGEVNFGGGAVYESLPPNGRRACRVETDGAAAKALAVWMAAQVAAGRYAPDPFVPDGDAWMTVDFVEPVLSLRVRRAGGRVTLRIVETNRES